MSLSPPPFFVFFIAKNNIIWYGVVSLVNLCQVTQQYPLHLLAHPQTPHCARRKQFDTAQAFFSNRKHCQDQSNPLLRQSQLKHVCQDCAYFCTDGDSTAYLHNQLSGDYFESLTTFTAKRRILSCSDGITFSVLYQVLP